MCCVCWQLQPVWCKSRMLVAVWRLARETAALQHHGVTGWDHRVRSRWGGSLYIERWWLYLHPTLQQLHLSVVHLMRVSSRGCSILAERLGGVRWGAVTPAPLHCTCTSYALHWEETFENLLLSELLSLLALMQLLLDMCLQVVPAWVIWHPLQPLLCLAVASYNLKSWAPHRARPLHTTAELGGDNSDVGSGGLQRGGWQSKVIIISHLLLFRTTEPVSKSSGDRQAGWGVDDDRTSRTNACWNWINKSYANWKEKTAKKSRPRMRRWGSFGGRSWFHRRLKQQEMIECHLCADLHNWLCTLYSCRLYITHLQSFQCKYLVISNTASL